MDYDDSMTLMLDDINLDSKGKSSGQCQVCGIDGAQYHYGGLCCVSCKMFFRRNSKFDLVSKILFYLKLINLNLFRILMTVYLKKNATSQ